MNESFAPKGTATGLVATMIATIAVASANASGQTSVTVTIENLAPPNGGFLTPVWVGFHDGGFDLYDRGAAASQQLERIAEDGNTDPLTAAFAASGNGVEQGTLISDFGIPPLAPGETATMKFTLDGDDASSRYFSYASMVIPSNDAFTANGNPRAHRIFNRGGHFRGVDFIVWGTDVLDAGTELNDEDPENTAFFGQAMPNTGQDENVGIHTHPGLMFPGSGGILDDPIFENADFLTDDYMIARITVSSSDDDSDDDSSDESDDDSDS